MGKHIDWLGIIETICPGAAENRAIARLGGGITADIHDPTRAHFKHPVHHFLVHPRSGRIDNHHVRCAMPRKPRIIVNEPIFQITTNKRTVVNTVFPGVPDCVFYRGFNRLNAHDFARICRNMKRNGPCSRIEIEDEIARGDFRHRPD
jgi:hypothetical protein